METRVALIAVVVENPDAVMPLNALLHEYSRYIIGRMGIPYHVKKLSLISIAMDAPQDVISALSGKLGMLDGVSIKPLIQSNLLTKRGGSPIRKGRKMYDVKSMKAEEFISHDEILDTLEYARKNANNAELIDEIIAKAKLWKGLSHREAAVLLLCEIPEKNAEIFGLAEQLKKDFYGNRIVLFAPLYLSNYCVNGCVYCPYHIKNKHIPRKKLTQEQIRAEVIALQDMGHKRLALEAGEDPVNNPIEYILESIKTIYSIKHKNGAIRRVNVNIAATTVENYKKLHEAGIGTYILFQETYNRESYEKLHPTGPKHNYAYHTEAMDRAMQGGIDDVGLGVLYGLENYAYEFVGQLMHAEHLEAVHGVGPHTISVPRICPLTTSTPRRSKTLCPTIFLPKSSPASAFRRRTRA